MNRHSSFNPCPLCGNCAGYKRSKINPDSGKVDAPADCRSSAKPERSEENGRGRWSCEEFKNRNKKNKSPRRIKPHQRGI